MPYESKLTLEFVIRHNGVSESMLKHIEERLGKALQEIIEDINDPSYQGYPPDVPEWLPTKIELTEET